nr:hypothetical protein [Tanacetum cinerariifolium]
MGYLSQSLVIATREEFAGEHTLLKSIPPRIDETDCDFEEDIHLIEKLLYDNSSPCPPEEFVSANSDAKSESFSPSHILVKDSDSLMEEIDLFCTTNYPMPPSIVDEDYDSERDILIPKDLPSNNTLSFAKKESFYFDIPSFLFLLQNHQMEKSPDLLSHRGLKAFQHYAKCPMMIHGQNNPILDYSVNPSLNIQNELDNHELFINELIQQKLQKENNFAQLFPAIAIILDLATVEPKDSLRMGDEHLDTIPKTKSDEFIKSCVDSLVPNPSKSEDEHECDMPACDDFTTFFDFLFDADDDFSSSDDKSFSDEDIPKEIFSNPLFDEEIISIKIDPHHSNVESDLIEYLLKLDSLIISSFKIYSLLDEFKLLYDKSSPRPPKEFISKNSDAAIESFSLSPIPIEDSNSLREEIDLSLTLDDSMPLGIKNDNYDSEGDILILEEFLSNDSLSLPENESFHFDYPSSLRPPAKPPDDDEIRPNLGILTVKVVGDISEQAHVGYNFPAQVPSVQTLPSFPQQYPCCEDSGVTYEPYQCQPKNHDYYNEQNSCFDSKSFGFDQSQPQQYTVNHPILNAHNDYLDSQIQLNSTLAKITEQMTSITSSCEMACKIFLMKLEEKQLEEERVAKAQNWKLPVCYNDDVDEERFDSLDDNIIFGLPLFSAITPNEPVLSTEEPDNSLSMGDEHLDTIPATESDEVIKSSVKNLIPIPSESEGIPEHKCDVPSHDNSPPLDVSKDQFEDLSESNDEFSSIDDDSFSIDKIDYVEASPLDSKLFSSEVMEIVIPKVGGIDDDILHEKLLNVNHLFTKIEASNDNPIPFYDPIIFGTLPTLTPSGESDFFLEVDAFLAVEDEPTSSQFPKSYLDTKGDILLLEAFLNDDHSSDFKTKSSSTSLNSLLEETNTFDNSLTESDTLCFDVEEISSGSTTTRTNISLPEYEASYDDQSCSDEDGDIHLIEKLLYDNSSPRPSEEFVSANFDADTESFSPSPILVKDNDSLMEEFDLFCTPDYLMSSGIEEEDYDSERDILILKILPSNNTLSFAEKESFHFDIPSFFCPLAKPPDGDTGILNIKMMGDIFDQKAFMNKLMITLAPHQEKSPDLLSHRCLKAF